MALNDRYTKKLQRIISSTYLDKEKLDNVKNHKALYKLANEFITKSLCIQEFENKVLACECFSKIVSSVDTTEYLLLDAVPRVPREMFLNALWTLGTLLKTIGEVLVNNKMTELNKNNANRTNDINLQLTTMERAIFDKALASFITLLQVDFENSDAIKQIISIYTQLTYISQSNHETALRYLNEALMFEPINPIINYNLGHIYQRMNQLERSIIHYKLSIELNKGSTENKLQLDINNYNGIASIYRSIKKWPESLHYLLKAHTIDKEDPDINNQLGVVYTEMRRTDLGEEHYKLAIKHYRKTFVSTDPTFLLAEIYLNYGHLHSYNGNNNKSIECYNESLKIVNKFALPFQNKLMNLCYVFDQLPDDNKMYITDQHKKINKLYTKNPAPYSFKFNGPKINVGIVSGDFANHPVSYFISTFLKNFDNTRFNVTCYSECIIRTENYNKNLQFKIIKNMSQSNAADLIYNDNIHILLDLAGHTSHNRLDIFAFKPAPIQISYIGYPWSTGLTEMDYRITDAICDGDLSISQPFYTETLITLPNAFMCYDYRDIDNTNTSVLPILTETPRLRNPDELVIGCFNRLNKITDPVIQVFNNILIKFKNVKFLFKTKALINPVIRTEFLNKFDITVQHRIMILDCTLSHLAHLETYNQMDISIDTWPYSGTTTTCESLLQGCPVLSLYDTHYFYHPSNVSVSILKNSDLEFYVCENAQEILDKIQILLNKPTDFWTTHKSETRSKFLNGNFCNKQLYMTNIETLFTNLYLGKSKLY